jgi:hypothetical protein
VPDVVIENPILNSPYAVPTRHWRFNDDGITDEIEEGRRKSAYFMPIPASRRRSQKPATTIRTFAHSVIDLVSVSRSRIPSPMLPTGSEECNVVSSIVTRSMRV